MLKEIEKITGNIISKIGAKRLLTKLKEIEVCVDYNMNKDYIYIKAIVLDYFKIDEKDLFSNSKEPNDVNSRRLLVYLLKEKTTIPKKSICEIVQIDSKAFKRYVNYVSHTILNNHTDPELAKALNEINNIYYHS